MIIIFFIIIGLIIIYNFRGYNQKRALDGCIAGS